MAKSGERFRTRFATTILTNIVDYIKIDLIPFGQQNGLTAREIAN
jgi:hypothetical protein